MVVWNDAVFRRQSIALSLTLSPSILLVPILIYHFFPIQILVKSHATYSRHTLPHTHMLINYVGNPNFSK